MMSNENEGPSASTCSTSASSREFKRRRDATLSAIESFPTGSVSSLHQSQWQATVEKSIFAVVSIRFMQPISFDTDGAEISEASGFIVDRAQGIILTNRHVACLGPFVGVCIFHDLEEVEVRTIYRDPVHDFGFLKFDPSSVRYTTLSEIPLRPDLAKVGLEIRVLGNDAGEKLSILAGSISRINRNAPEYDNPSYNDFNTFYLQAAASASGGSSGSPVIDIEGNAVALQAGGRTNAATDFFLPLDRVARALEYIRLGQRVPRGTVQVCFRHRPFDAVRRLGLTRESEDAVRALLPAEIGMLAVHIVVPEGPGYELLEEGDVVIRLNGSINTSFVTLAEVLDTSIGNSIELEVERCGKPLSFKLKVQDLHELTPNQFLEVSGTVLNNLSYHLAQSYCIPLRGVYIAENGNYPFENAGWILESVDDEPVPNLDAMVQVLKKVPHQAMIPVVAYCVWDIYDKHKKVIRIDKRWNSFRLGTRNDETGIWDFTYFPQVDKVPMAEPITVQFPRLPVTFEKLTTLHHSLVRVYNSLPLKLDGFPNKQTQGAGIVLDARLGLVLVGRTIVPFDLGEIFISFAESVNLPASIEFLHPTQNYAIIRYNPSLLGDTWVESARFSNEELKQGSPVCFLGLDTQLKTVCLNTVVRFITSTTDIAPNYIPRYRAINFELISMESPSSNYCPSGVLATENGEIQAFWLTFMSQRSSNGTDVIYHSGIHVNTVLPVLQQLQAGQPASLYVMGIEVKPVPIMESRQMGLAQEWINKVEQTNEWEKSSFMIQRIEADSPAKAVLQECDIIVAIDDKVFTRLSDLNFINKPAVDLTILRNKVEMRVQAPLRLYQREKRKFVLWAGALIQEPFHAVLQQSQTLPSQIYISARCLGSPAFADDLPPTMWITRINGNPVRTLDDFLAQVTAHAESVFVQVSIRSFDGIPSVSSVRQNFHYWPTIYVWQDDNWEWQYKLLSNPANHVVFPGFNGKWTEC